MSIKYMSMYELESYYRLTQTMIDNVVITAKLDNSNFSKQETLNELNKVKDKLSKEIMKRIRELDFGENG